MGLKTLQNNLGRGMSNLYLFLSFFILFLSTNTIYGQCPGPGTENAVSPLISNGSSQMVNIAGDEYVRIYLCGGEQYTFATCGETDFNTEITLRSDDNVTELAYDNDGCGTDQATVNYTPASDGFIRVLLHNYIDNLNPVPDVPCQATVLTTPLTITQNTGTGCAPIGWDCANPNTSLTVGGTLTGLTTCDFGDQYGNTDACSSLYMNGEDYVFTFSPPSDGCYSINLANNTDATGLFVIDDCPDTGTCIAFDEAVGGNPSVNADLLSSTTYYIIVDTNPAIVGGATCTNFDISLNNCATGTTCASAQILTDANLGTPLTGLTTNGFGDDYDTTPCADGTNTQGTATPNNYIGGDDFIFTYTPTNSDCYIVSLSNFTGDAGFFVLNDCPDVATNCFAAYGATTATELTAKLDLTGGTAYTIVVSSWPNPQFTDFDFLIETCPDGVDCEKPLVINSVPYAQTGLTTLGFFDDYDTSPCDDNYMTGDDFVFEFQPASDGCYQIDLTNTDAFAGLHVLDGCPTDAGVNCIAFEGSGGTNPSLSVYLESTTTYNIIISTFADSQFTPFDISLTECVNAGENCTDAFNIVAGAFPHTETGMTTCAYGNNYNSADGCGSLYMNGEETVFTFTPSTDGCFDFSVLNETNLNADMGLFILDDCPDAASVNCIAQSTADNNPPSTVTANLLASTTYYIVVSAQDPECTGFDLQINTGTCPPGYTCALPYNIAPGSFPHTEAGLTSCGAGNDYGPTDACNSTYMDGEDFVMTFTPTVTDCYNFAVANTTPTTDVGLFVLTDCPDSGSASCIAQDEVDNGGPATDAYLTAGETYYIVVSAIEFDITGLIPSPSCTDFDLTINTGGTNCPFGAICSNPDVISSLPYAQTGLTTCGFGDDYDSADGCASIFMTGDDYVFSFTPTVTDCYNIDITNTGNNPTGLFVLDNCPDVPTANCVASNEDEDFDGEPSVTSDLQAGTTYYIIVSTDANDLLVGTQCTPFDISMTQGCPIGTSCASANVIGSSPSSFTNLTSCGAGYQYDDTQGCGGNYMTGEDYVFEFTPSATECYLLSLDNATDANADWGISITDACPDDPTANCVGQITADNNTPGIDLTLTMGTTYYIVIDTWSAPDCSGFDFNIGSCPAAAIEQDCIGAIPVCTDNYNQPNSYVGEGAIPGEINTGPSCLENGERNDVWYLITIQSDGIFNFEIQPTNAADDYDWAIYDLTNNVCSDIFSNASLEISCNYSQTVGTTGTGNAGLLDSQGAVGTPFNAPINVSAGDILVLNISNFSSTQDGYDLDLNPPLSPSTAGIFDNVAAEFSAVDPNIPCGATTLDVTFSDPVLCNTVEACDFQITGPGGPYTITDVLGGNCTDSSNGDLYERDFTLTINPPLTASGDFTIALVPLSGTCGSITDKCGNIASNGEDITFTLNNVTVSITNQTDANCGDNAGSVTVEAANGTAPYDYAIDGGTFQTSGTFPNLIGGSYVVTAMDDVGCTIDIDITINDNGTNPDATAANDSPTCEGNDINLTSSTTTVGTTTYAWAGPNSFGSGDQNPVIIGATTAAAGIYTVTITVDGCSATATTAISINTLPDLTVTNNSPTCEGGDVTLMASTTAIGTTTYNWGGPNSYTSTEQNPVLTSIAAADIGTYNVTVTVDGCSSSGNTDVTITSQENATFTIAATVCETDANPTPTLDGAATGGGTWTIDNSGTIDATTGEIDLTTTSAGNFNVTYTTPSTTCGDAETQPITIEAQENATFTIVASVCLTDANPSPTLDAGATTGGTWTIDNGGTIDATTGEVNVTVSGAGNFNVTYTTPSTTCGDNESQPLEITDQEDATFTIAATVCTNDANPTPILDGGATTGGTWTIDNGGTIDATTGEVNVTASGAGNFNITYTTPSATCGDTQSQPLAITDQEDATFTITASVCETDANPTPTLDAGATTGGTWIIDNGGTIDATTGEVDVTASGIGSYNVTYTTPSGSCGDSQSQPLAITDQEDATFTIAATVCTSDANPIPTLDAGATTGGTWTIDNGGTIDVTTGEVNVTASGAGNFNITYTTSNPTCGDTQSQPLAITNQEDATFTITASVCETDANPTPTLDAGATTGGTWTIDNGSTIDATTGEVDVTASGAGNFNITYTTPSATCGDTQSQALIINPQPTSDFTVSSTSVCVDGIDFVTITYTGTAPVGSTFNWNFGGGNASPGTGEGPHTVTWTSGTTANITLTVSSNGCDSGSNSQQITLSAPLETPNISCTSTPNSVSFNWQDIVGVTGYTISYTINSGTVTNATSTTSDFDINGLNPLDEVDITVIANGPAPCGDSEAGTGNCTAEDCPTVISIDNLSGPYCTEDGAFELQGTPTGGTFSGTGVSGGQFDPASVGAGTHTITYDVTEGDCDYTISQSVNVNESPTADFTLSDTEVCADGSQSIVVTYTGNAGTGATYNWNFGSATASPGGTTQGPHTLTWNGGTGSVNILLSVTENGCSSASNSQNVTLSEPLATPAIDCGTLTTSEVNFDWGDVTGATGYSISYTINSGVAVTDNTATSDYQVTGLSPNDMVIITVIALGDAPCGDSAAGTQTCTAQDCPTNISPNIDNLNASYCEDDGAFTLQATPTGGTFSGTGVSGTQFNPSTAGEGGPYTITYDYTDPISGCDYQATAMTSINAVPTSDFTLSDSQVCADGSQSIVVTYTGTASATGAYNWNFGGGDASPGTGQGPHTVTWSSGIGNVNVTLSVSENGCDSDITSQSMTLSAPLTPPTINCNNAATTSTLVAFDWNDVTGATGYTITYTVNGGTSTNDTSVSSDYEVLGLTAGDNVTITVVATGGAPCGDSASSTATCQAQDCPDDITIDNLLGTYCSDEAAFILQGTPTGGTFSGTGVSGGQFDPSIGAGTYTITYDYTDAANGCEYSTNQSVTVNDVPTSDFTASPTDICADGLQSASVTYTGGAGTGATYNWNFGGGTAVPGTGRGPHTVTWTNGTTANIMLTVTANGCTSPESTQNVNLSAPLTAPVVTCGTTTTSEVNFDWADIAGATGYSISYTINSSPATTASSATSDYQVTGLNPLDEVTITVIADGPAPCGDSAAGTGTCIAEDCPTINPSITGLNANYCADAGSVALTGTPTGGTFSGTGISGNNFEPSTAGAGGPYTITYDYTDTASGCDFQTTTIVNIDPVPTASFTVSPDPICADGSSVATVTFTGTAGTGSTYNWNFGGGNASPGGNVAGPHVVTWDSGTSANLSLTVSQNGCVSPESTQSVTLAEPLAAPSVNCTGSTTSSVSFDWADIAGAISYDISYTINGGTATSDNTSTSTYDVNSLNVNDEVVITVIAVGPAPCGNSIAGTAECEALDCPTQNLTITGLDATYCADASEVTLTGTPAGGTFSGTGVNSATSTFNPENAGVGGPYTITYTFIDPTAPDCDYSTSQQVSVRAVPTSDFVINPSDVCADGLQTATVTYTGGAGTGATYNWNFGGGTAVPGGNVQGPHTVTWASGSGSVAINLSVTANSCSSTPTSQNVNLSSPLATPTVSCGSSTTNSVTFDWADITGNAGYEVTYTINGGTVQNDNTAASTYTVNGLNVNDEVIISVVAVGSAPCGNSEVGSQTCTAEDCPDITPTISGLDAAYCSDAGVVTLTGTPAGGMFSGPGISGDTFDPANAGSGLITIMYDYQEGDCSYTTSLSSTISGSLTAPTVTCGVTTTSSVEFTWTAVTGATGYNITISGAATDNQTVTATTFTVTGLNVNDVVTIVVEPIGDAPCGNGPTGTTTCTAEDCAALPTISIDNLNVQYCADDAVVDPILATPAGGVFSGAGIVGNSFDPSMVGAASTTILYTYTDPVTDCEYTTTFAVTILPPYDAPLVECGTSTTSSVTFNWNNVGTNDYVVTYTIEGGVPITENVTGTTFTVGSLTTGNSVDISVVALGIPPCADSPAGTATCVAEDCVVINPTITGLNAMYCSNEVAVNLTVEPTGGILSGSGVSGNSFDPSNAGTGTITLTYDYTDSTTGCTYQTTETTTLSNPLAAPIVTCGTTTSTSIAFNWTAVTGATGYNISWSGAATGSQTLTDLTFELTGLTANDEVTLIVEPIGGAPCGNGPTGTATCTANDCPTVAIVISGLDAQYCGDDALVTLSATPTGGTFSGPGVSGNTFDPSIAGQQDVTIVYDYTDPDNADCTYQQPISTTVLPPYGVPTVTCGTGTTSSVTFDWEDVGSASYQVTLAGAVTNSFTTGATTHTESGLSEGDQVTITVIALGVAPCGDSEGSTVTCTAEACQPVGISITGLDVLYCSTDGVIALTGLPSGGTFVGTGITGNSFDPVIAGVGGPYTIFYDYTDAATGCEYQTSATVSVNAPLATPTVTCSDESLNEVSFSWDAIAGASQYEIIVSINSVAGAAQTTSNTTYTESGLTQNDVVDISVVALGSPPCGNSAAGTGQCTARDCPDVALTLDIAEQYCGRDPAVTLTPTPVGGTLSGPGITGTSFNPFAAGIGVHSIVYTYVATDGCSYQESFTTTVLPPSGAPVVTCASVSMNSITFEWADVGTGSYQITLLGAVVDVAMVSNTSYTVTGLSTGESVTIEVIALSDDCGNSEPASVTCTTGDCGDTVMTIIGLDAEYCSDGGDVVLTVVDQDGNAITDGSFSGDGIVGGLFRPSQAGTGTVTIAYNYTDVDGCDFVAIATTNISPALVTPTVICAGTTVTSVAFSWDDVGAGMYNIVVTVNGTETDNLSASTLSFDKTGLTTGDEVGITVMAVGTALCGDSEAGTASCTAQDCGGSAPTIDNLLTEYCGASSSTFTLAGTPVGGEFSGPGVTGDSFDPSAAGQQNVTIVYTVTDTDGCVYQTTANTEILPPFDVPAINCAAVTTNSVSVEWSDVGSVEYRLTIQVNGGTPRIETVSGTTYTETGLNVSDEVTITVVAVGVSACGDSDASTTSCIAADCPVLTLAIEGLGESYCVGDPAVTLTATLDGEPVTGGNFIGAAISGGNIVNPEILLGGLYLISYVYNEPNGCQYITTESFSVGGVVGDIIGVDSPIIAGNAVPLSVDAFSATGGDLTYEWSPIESLDCTDCVSVNATPTETTTYEVLVSDSEGCNRSFSTTVEVTSESDFTIPTAFTPNGDGDNDTFGPVVQGSEEVTFQVFSRWGEKIHDMIASDATDIGWDGTYKDELMPIGSYVYVIMVTYRSGEQKLERGYFQLLR